MDSSPRRLKKKMESSYRSYHTLDMHFGFCSPFRFPTASDGFIKQAACDLEIEGGMVIPKETPLWIPLYALHR